MPICLRGSGSLVVSATPQHRLKSVLLEVAKEFGWANVSYAAKDVLYGIGSLGLGDTQIPVRMLLVGDVADEAEMVARFERIQADCKKRPEFEQYLVMHGFRKQSVSKAQNIMGAVPNRVIHVGTSDEFISWLQYRNVPMQMLTVNGPVRRLVEPMMQLKQTQIASRMFDTGIAYDPTGKIVKSFNLGKWGVDGVTTVFNEAHGADQIKNVEQHSEWQKKDIDLLVYPSDGGSPISVEVKTEDYQTGKLSYETISNATKGSAGWFEYCEADVLVHTLRASGHVIIQDFKEVRSWIRNNIASLEKREGSAPGQSYKSEIILVPIERILSEVPNTVVLLLSDWIEANALSFDKAKKPKNGKLYEVPLSLMMKKGIARVTRYGTEPVKRL